MPNSPDSLDLSSLRTVFLDRDGVLNRKMPEGQFVTRWSEFHPLPRVAEALARLNRASLRVIVVSNQRGVSLGLYSVADVQSIHAEFQSQLKAQGARIDAFYFCPHGRGECNCRKPLTGLFEQARADFPQITAASSLMIGDALSDVEFGRRVGMTTIFLDGNPEHRKPGAEAAAELADLSFPNLAAAVDFLLDRMPAR